MLIKVFNSAVIGIFNKLIDIVCFVLLLALCSKTTMGQYSHYLALSAFFYLAIDIGLSQTLLRQASQKSISLAAIYQALLKPSRLVCALLIPLVLVLALQLDPIAVLLFCGFQLCALISNLHLHLLKAQKHIVSANVIALTESLFKLGLILLLKQIQNEIEASAILLVLLLGKLLSCAISTIAVCKALAQKQPAAKSSQLNAYSLAFFTIALLNFAQTRLDWIVIQAWLSPIELANYALANRLFEYAMFALTIISVNVLPWLYNNSSADKDKALRLKTAALKYSPIAIVIAIALLPYIDSWFWQNKYQDAYLYCYSLLLLTLIAQINSLLYYLLISHQRDNLLLKNSLVLSVLQFACVIALVPLLGIWAGVIGMWLLNLGNLLLLLRQCRSIDFDSYKNLQAICLLLTILVLAMQINIFYLNTANTAFNFVLLVIFLITASLWKKPKVLEAQSA